MAAYILFDTEAREKLYPFTLTRPVADCRTGILTIREKWERLLNHSTSTYTAAYLSELFPLEAREDNYWIHGGLLPDRELLKSIKHLPPETLLTSGETPLLARSKNPPFNNPSLKKQPYTADFKIITYPWDLLKNNDEAIQSDLYLLTSGRKSEKAGKTVTLLGENNIFIEAGASILCATLNASHGPIYIGKNAVIQEGCHIRGPFSLGENSIVKMGAKIYGATSIGPHSMAGGEINRTIFFGYSNKAHDGYIGDSVLGEWCNWGAGTTCSNLKNSTRDIKIWVEKEQKQVPVGQKCGVMMGDLSRTAVQTKINSGTLVGVSAHLFGDSFPPKQVPSFYWNEKEKYQHDKAIRDAKGWMHLKGKEPEEKYLKILTDLYHHTTP